VVPAEAGAVVTHFVAKVSQGNQARDGDAYLYKDGPTDLGTLIGTCAINAEVGDSVTTCEAPLSGPANVLVRFDSLSCYFETDGGSFEGGSCSILIDLGPSGP
jgi:hypothetical protein